MIKRHVKLEKNPTQLEQDLVNFAVDKFQLVIKDTLMRCEVVKLSDQESFSIVASAFSSEFIRVLNLMNIGPAEAGRMIFEMYEMALEHNVLKRPQTK